MVTPMMLKPQSPIYVAGLARAGTSWLGKTLSTGAHIKYFHEPFNMDNVPEALPHWGKYLRMGEPDQEFLQFCQSAFAGQIRHPNVIKTLTYPYRALQGNLSWLPGRTLIKDVHSLLSLAWIDQQFAPIPVVIIRHPCAIAASWTQTFKLNRRLRSLDRILEQPQLMEDYLHPYESLMQSASGFWQEVAVYWGATYHVVLQQQRQHPNWIVLSHEQLCGDPVGEYRQLFERLNLRWTAKTERFLQGTTTTTGESYSLRRRSSQEPDKWRTQLQPDQIDQIQKFAAPFEIPFYQL
jgi:hypothetical protein